VILKEGNAMADIDAILQENTKKIDAALAAIDPKLAQVSEEIKKFDVKPDKVYFLDKEGNKITEGNSGHKLKIPSGTAKIIANGNAMLNGDLDNIAVFAKTSVTANNTDSDSKIIAGGDVNIAHLHLGNVAAGGNFITHGIIFGDVAAKGRVFGNATQSESKIHAGKDVHITGSVQGTAITSGNFVTESAIHGEVAAKGNVTAKDTIFGKVIANGNVTAKDTQFSAEIMAGGDVNTTLSQLGKITAGRNFSTQHTIMGEATAGRSITAKEVDGKAKIDAPQLFLPKGAKEPENFTGEIIEIPKAKWNKLKQLSTEENAKALEDFRIIVGGTYTHAKDIDFTHNNPAAVQKPTNYKHK